MTDTVNLGLPQIEASQAQKHVTHNEALRMLDALVMLAVIDRDLGAPPGSQLEGDRYIVATGASGGFAGHDGEIAHYADGGWNFYAPRSGWLAFIEDEAILAAWDGTGWNVVSSGGGTPTALQDMTLLGVGTTADSTNPFSATLNNALWSALTVADGGDGDLRYKMSKESAASTLSLLFQDNFSGRAEIGLTGDDDFHFKTSADGSSWADALLFDKATGSSKINSGFFLTGSISPTQITADQNDYNPSGLSGASVLRLSTDASRNITGLSGGGAGRVAAVVNVGTNAIVLKNASTSSSAGNRFSFSADVTLAAKQSVVLWYDSTDARWKLLAGPQAAGGGGGDLLASQNLADLANQKTAFDNLSLHGADVASAGTLNLESATGNLVDVTGTTTVTAITLSEGHERTVRFTGALTLTHGSSLVLPGALSIATTAGDFAIFRGYASGVVRCVTYLRANGKNLGVAQSTIASGATTDLGSALSQAIAISGTTTITSFGSSAPAGDVKFVQFSGALTLTHNGTSLILPGAANIVTASGDCVIVRHEGSGNWRVLTYMRAAGRPLNSGQGDTLAAGFAATSYSNGTKSSGTFTPDPLNGNIQHYTNGGAHTLAPPGNPCTIILECTNASAGAITTSGFSIVSGDAYSSSGTKKHIFRVTRTNSYSELNVTYVTGT